MQPRPAERQPAHAVQRAAVRAAPVVVAAPPSASQALQRKLGNAGLSAVLAGQEQRVGRVAANPSAAPVVARSPAQALVVSSPLDPAEREAEKVGRRVMAMSPGPTVAPRVGKPEAATIARAAAPAAGTAPGAIDPETGRELEAAQSGGSPLPEAIRNHMERSFHADFSTVRIHTDERAARLSVRLAARAFTRGNHIFFARGAFSPETRSGGELIAHELTHTIQQRAVVQHAPVQRAADPQISERATPHVQRFALSDIPGFLAERANAIPGFRMFTIVLGVNPINMAPVDRSAANVLRAVVEFIPGGVLITAALDAYGIFDRVGGFIDQQLRSLGITGAAIRSAVTTFIDSLGVSDIFSPGDVWNRAVAIFSTPIRRIIDFVAALGGQVLDFIRDAILRPLANLASQTRGWDLLIAVLGKNPITGEAVPRTAENLIGGFMKLIGQEEVWENAKKSNAVPRAWAWFQGALATVVAFVSQIPGLFLAALRTLGIADLAALPSAFARVAGVFANFVGQFFTWAGTAVWNLLEIIFDVVSPGALAYIKKTGAALKSILKNPLPFVGNLVRAAKLGLQNFADNFGTHLKAGLIDWLTGSLPGVYIPKAFSLVEVGKFALSVLGITWTQIRGKIVKALGPTGETIMKGLETGFDIVVALVKGGPAAAWEVIKDKLTNLKDMVIEGITSFVVDTIVKKAIPKLISMFIPGAGFISAILSIYDTVMVFVQKLSKIAAAVIAFIDSIVAIAAGQVDPAAKKVESTLAGLLSLAISFLAGFLGLGNIASKVMGVIEKVRAAVDKALDTAIAWIVGKAKALFAKLFGKGDEKKLGTDGPTQKVVKDISMMGVSHRLTVEMKPDGLDVRMASADSALIQKVNDEITTQDSIIQGLSPGDTDLISYHTRTKAALQGIVSWYNGERVRINGLRTGKSTADVAAMLRDLGEQLATKIIRVAAEFRLDDFVRKTFNVAQHLESIRKQVEDQIEKHSENPNATGDGMAYTGAAAEMYLGWVEPKGRRHIGKVAVAIRTIDQALRELDKLTQSGVDMRGERWYVRGKNVLEMCIRAMSAPDTFLWGRGAGVVKAFIDDMDAQGQKGNAGAVAGAKRRLGMK